MKIGPVRRASSFQVVPPRARNRFRTLFARIDLNCQPSMT